MMYRVSWDNDGNITVAAEKTAEVVSGNIEYTRPGGRAGSVRTIVESFCGPRHQWCESERDAYVFGARVLLSRYKARIASAREALNKYTDWLVAHSIDAEEVCDGDDKAMDS